MQTGNRIKVPGTCDQATVPQTTCQINHTQCIQASRCDTGQLAPQFVSPPWLLAWKNVAGTLSLSLSVSPSWPPTGIHRSICYNKTTILAPTRDDSIGRSKADRAFFSESRASLVRTKQDAPVMVETSSKRYMPPSTALLRRPVSSWKWYEQSELAPAKGRERGERGRRKGEGTNARFPSN